MNQRNNIINKVRTSFSMQADKFESENMMQQYLTVRQELSK